MDKDDKRNFATATQSLDKTISHILFEMKKAGATSALEFFQAADLKVVESLLFKPPSKKNINRT
jgi:hypothetical protein